MNNHGVDSRTERTFRVPISWAAGIVIVLVVSSCAGANPPEDAEVPVEPTNESVGQSEYAIDFRCDGKRLLLFDPSQDDLVIFPELKQERIGAVVLLQVDAPAPPDSGIYDLAINSALQDLSGGPEVVAFASEPDVDSLVWVAIVHQSEVTPETILEKLRDTELAGVVAVTSC